MYGENYKVEFKENISEEKLKEYQAHLESLEEQVVNQAKAEMAEAVEHKKEAKEKKSNGEKSENSGNATNGEPQSTEASEGKTAEEEDTTNPVIYGRVGK